MNDYPSSLTVAPLTVWPGAYSRVRVASQFSAPLRATLELLTRELQQLQAQRPILEVAIPSSQFRIDGRPRAAAKADHPGVVLSLPHSNVGPLRYAADRFLTWQDNLRAIALGLEALRKIDRYGITRRGEQYVGFKALVAGQNLPRTVEDALAVLARHSGVAAVLLTSDDRWEAAYRVAVKQHHPDVGGRTEDFQEIQAAIEILRKAR